MYAQARMYHLSGPQLDQIHTRQRNSAAGSGDAGPGGKEEGDEGPQRREEGDGGAGGREEGDAGTGGREEGDAGPGGREEAQEEQVKAWGG